jgi:parallel beta-helix repeat protein
MNKSVLCILAALAAVLILGPARASAWTKDSDTAVNTSSLSSIVTQLLAPDASLGDTDVATVGVGDPAAVGISGTMSDQSGYHDDDEDHHGSSTHTLFVDDTPFDSDCPPTPYTTIQAAVNASGPGDTIKVCPGSYPEQVRISGHGHDYLKLVSLKPLQAVIQWPMVESPPLALVDMDTVNHVTLLGFTITGPFTFPACSPIRHEGVLVENAFHEHIVYNRITQIENSVPALRGCQEGDAVAIGHRTDPAAPTDAPGSAEIENNWIDEYQKNGVQVVNTGSFAEIDHNLISGPVGTVQPHAASNGVVIFRSAAGTVDRNAITNNQFGPSPLSTGVILDGAPPGSSRISYNRIYNNDFGIETDSQDKLEISHNDVFRNLGDAITLCGEVTQGCGPATRIVVFKNEVDHNAGSGILLLGADSNLLKSNEVEDNGTAGLDMTDGIRVDANSGGNVILGNSMDDNVTHDCHDASNGTGTAFTANFWKDNRGDTQNRPGLCKSH